MKKGRWIAALTAMVFLAAGCSGQGNAEGTTPMAGEESAGETELDVVLDWYPNAVHAFLYIAQEKGYFEEEGLKVNVLYPVNGNDAVALTAAGKADIGFYYQEDTIITKTNEDVPVKSIGTVVQGPISIFAALEETGIQTPADFKGKTIGYSSTEFGKKAIETAVKNVGLSLDDIELIDVGFDLTSSMTTGNVDATYGCFVNHEVPALEEKGFTVHYFSPTEYGVPNYYSLILVAGEKNLEEKEDAYTGFLRACQKGFQDMKESPEEALKILMDNQSVDNFPLSEYVETRSFEVLLPLMEQEGSPFLTQDKQVWQNNIDWLKQAGITEKALTPDDFVVNLLAE
ncbi:ABC transporter substrate-binding protein [Hominifimenecus sp. rT4P-3]|uniref:ABC transporter substrate-binding protein n=1 Tax=Hominifimenecus sp. rT4P-3 TaxID=3242979 RepID=UPI003DA49E22